MKKKWFSFLALSFLMLSHTSLLTGQDLYFNEKYVRNDNAVYRDYIRTVLLYKAGFELTPPIIQLFSPEKLVLSFDDFEGNRKPYRYTLVHCDAFWNESALQPMEYLDGFFEDNIDDYQYSFNTTRSYTNYVLVFPTDYLRIRRSGNYIIKVFEKDDRDENVILTRRFIVYEPQVTVQGSVVNTVDLNLRYTHQQVAFKLLPGNYNITDSHRDLHVFVMQNGRFDNMLSNIQPRSIVGGVYDYTLLPGLAFPAGNEFRYIDLKTLKYNTDRMQTLRFTEKGYEVAVQADKPRAGLSYISEEDINGRRLISVNGANDSYSEGDYTWVHFLLPYPYPLAEGNLYIGGSYCDWQYNQDNLLRYNDKLQAYEASIYVKQGYYNYAYTFVANRSNIGETGFIEGDFWEAENEYAILVYHRRQGDVYDALVGVGFLNSRD